ncbi:MAG TPA: hypothetical protein VN241_07490 [Microbacterium sp.]|nr:hypothetical protein [Microbacterium sp.]
MRGTALVVGGLLLVGGAGLVVIADQQREAAFEQTRVQAELAARRLSEARDTNYRLAETLTALRSQIAEQDARLNDESGFLE